MIAAVSSVEVAQILLRADREGYEGLARFLRGDPAALLTLDDAVALSSEATVPLTNARIVVTDSKLACRESDGCLIFSSDRDSLHWLADYFAELAITRGFGHVHLDYYEGHPYLAPEHVEVVAEEF